MDTKITLSGVPETMLQTVYARAKETRTRGAIHDEKAAEIIGCLSYDFSLADKDIAMHNGVIARTIVLDKLTEAYLSAHPGAVVLNLACGLDTRCYRMQGYSHWYNLDLPESIAVREKLLPENGSISQISMSAMEDWSRAIVATDSPVLVIIEGLTMYLKQADVQQIFARIAENFSNATVFVEIMNPMASQVQRLQAGGTVPWMSSLPAAAKVSAYKKCWTTIILINQKPSLLGTATMTLRCSPLSGQVSL